MSLTLKRVVDRIVREVGAMREVDTVTAFDERAFRWEVLVALAMTLYGRYELRCREIEVEGALEPWEKCTCLEDGESGVPAWHDHSCPRDAADDAAHHFNAIEHLCDRCAERLRYGEGDHREVCDAYGETEAYP